MNIRSLLKPGTKIGLAVRIAIAGYVLYAVVVGLVIPPVVRSLAPSRIAGVIRRPVTLDAVSINPFTLTLGIRGLKIGEPSDAGTFVSLGGLEIDLELASVVKRGLVLGEVAVRDPYVRIVRHEDGSYNFSDLLRSDAPKKEEKQGEPFRFAVSNISITGGSADFDDRPKAAKHSVRDLALGVPFVSNLPYFAKSYVQPHFSATVNEKQFVLEGKSKPFDDSLETTVDISFTGLDLPRYLAYVPAKLPVKIGSALLDTKLVVSFVQSGKKPSAITVGGDLALRELAVDATDASPLVRLPKLGVTIAKADVVAKDVHISRIGIERPEAWIVRDQAGVLNLQKLSGAQPAPKESVKADTPEKDEGKPVILSVDELRLEGGTVRFKDATTPQPFVTTLAPIDVTVRGFGTAENAKATAAFAAMTEAGEKLSANASFTVKPLAADGDAAARAIMLRKYMPYLDGKVLFTVASGTLDATTRFAFRTDGDAKQVTLNDGGLSLIGLTLHKQADSHAFLKLRSLKVAGTSVDLTRRQVVVGDLSVNGLSAAARRDEDGKIDLAGLVPPPASPGSVAPSPATPPPAAVAGGKDAPAWSVTLKQTSVQASSAVFTDDALPYDTAVTTIDEIALTARDISTVKGSRGQARVSCRLNGRGSLSVDGALGIAPVAADMALAVKGLELAPFQPYLDDKVNATVVDGKLSVTGRAAIARNDGKTDLRLSGSASLDDLAVLDGDDEELLKWRRLALSGIEFSSSPVVLGLREVVLDDPYAWITVSKTGVINLKELVAQQKTAEQPAQSAESKPEPQPAGPPAEPPRVTVGSVSVTGGVVRFHDRSVSPAFATNLTGLTLTASGISTVDQSKPADLAVSAKLDGYAPLDVKGRIAPVKDRLFADIKLQFKGIELSSASPYSGTYAGYAIQKGKLNLDLAYLVENKKLDATNVVFLDQFTFGDEVKSDKATKLPVRFAISLLKDGKGEIHLDVPVSGRTDDPKFSVFGVVVQVIVNLLTKAATSPFSLIAALAGGEELSFVEFAPGSAAITADSQRRIQALTKALVDRPSLKIDMEGRAIEALDTDKLRDAALLRRLKAQKLKDLSRSDAAVALDAVMIGADEYPKYLKAAWREEFSTRLKSLIGIGSEPSQPEMERALRGRITVTNEMLRKLAAERAEAARAALMSAGRVDAGRVFVLEPKIVTENGTRVQFSLK